MSEGELRQLAPDAIQVPDLRVTSEVDPTTMAEMEDSIRGQGILQPLQVAEVDGVLWLIDGLHRLLVARRLGLATVPCLVRPGNVQEVLLHNLIVNRQRGRSNPAQEAKLIRQLREADGYPLEKIAELTGLSIGWTRRLHDISYLPPAVLDLVADGRLGVTHAMELLRLQNDAYQGEVAQQAVEWRYTVEQVRARVQALLNPQVTPTPGAVGFGANGAPTRIPIPCYVCHVDLTDHINYIYVCGACQALLDRIIGLGQAALQAPAAAAAPAAVEAAAGPATGAEPPA